MVAENTGSWSRRAFLETTGAVGTIAAFGGLTAAKAREPGPKEDELLVGVSAGTGMAQAQQTIADAVSDEGSVVHRNDRLRYLAVKFRDESSATAESPGAERLREIPGVKYVEENATHETFLEPNDTLYDDQYAPQLVNAPQAWDSTLGSDDVTIAIIDQGVKYDHEDLRSRFGADKGRDFVDNDSDPMPDHMTYEYHGTHVAGIASGTTNNGTGIAGMSNSTLLSARALSEQGTGSTADIADAIQWAGDQGADLINMSLGGGGYQQTMKNAVSYALDRGTLSICAAGNDGSQDVSYPAAYVECVAVSAIDENENLAYFSNYGQEIDVAAPGVDVLSCSTRNGGYELLSGTSMASPATTGVAALGLATHPGWGPAELRSNLKSTAVDIGLPGIKQGGGRVDAANLVDIGGGNQPPTAAIDVSETEPDVGETVTFDASGSTDPDGTIVEYRWEDDDGDVLTGEVVEAAAYEARPYRITLTVTDDAGATDSTSVTVYVGGQDGDNQPPTANFTVTPSDPRPGETVTLDGGASTDPDGTITEYYWTNSAGDGVSGEVVELSAPPAGSYDVTLRVTDDDGAIDTITKTVTVVSDDGQCGSHENTHTSEGTLNSYLDSETFYYTNTLSDPCQVTVSLEGPSNADFDLFLTTDGRRPTIDDHDRKSISLDSEETIVVETVEPGQAFGVLVDSWSGGGDYTATVEELGK
jgi:serine protease